MFFDPRAEAIAEVRPGERFVVETADSLCGLVKQNAPRGFSIDHVVDQLGGACPVTGPIYVSGATPGDVLEVRIERVSATPATGQGWTGIFEGFGALTHDRYSLQPPIEPVTTLVNYDSEAARLDLGDRTALIPMRPFLGTVGVAPPRERRMSGRSTSPRYSGDWENDIRRSRGGATPTVPRNGRIGIRAVRSPRSSLAASLS